MPIEVTARAWYTLIEVIEMARNNRQSSRTASMKMAFCGLITALSVTLMLAGGMIPIATYCVPMAAGLLLLPVSIEFGKKSAWTTFAATALIAILLGIDKEAALFYLFIGYYPLIKWEFDRIKHKPLRLFLKLTLYSISVIAMYLVLGFVLNMNAVLAEFSDMGLVFTTFLLVLYNICMLHYDRLLLPLIFLYAQRIKPRLHFIKH